jgi:hypothetical protein
LCCIKSGWRFIGRFSPAGVGVKFAQSSIQWEARADTCRNVPNLADQLKTRKPGLSTRSVTLSQRKLASTARKTLFAL